MQVSFTSVDRAAKAPARDSAAEFVTLRNEPTNMLKTQNRGLRPSPKNPPIRQPIPSLHQRSLFIPNAR